MSAPLIAVPAIVATQRREFDPLQVGLESFRGNAAAERNQVVSSYLDAETDPDTASYIDAVATAACMACEATEVWMAKHPEEVALTSVPTTRPELAVRGVTAFLNYERNARVRAIDGVYGSQTKARIPLLGSAYRGGPSAVLQGGRRKQSPQQQEWASAIYLPTARTVEAGILEPLRDKEAPLSLVNAAQQMATVIIQCQVKAEKALLLATVQERQANERQHPWLTRFR